MTRTLNEGQHPGEFIVSLANHTRSKEQGLLDGPIEIKDGTPVVLSGDHLIPATTTSVLGILIGTYNLGTDDQNVKVAYVARDAEVKEALLNLPTNGTQNTNVRTGIKALGIVLR